MSIPRAVRFIAACAAGIIRPFVHRGQQGQKTIALVQFGKLGDLVCTTPMFRAVKRTFPNARLLVVCRGAGAGILEGNSDIDELVRFDRLGFWGTIKRLRQVDCSFGTMTNPDFNGLALLLIAGLPMVTAPRVIGGYCPQETRLYRILRRFVHAIDHRMGSYAPREYLKLLELAGIHSDDTTKHLTFSASADVRVTAWLRDAGVTDGAVLIGIAPAAGNRIKIWPAERFARVAEHIAAYPKTHVIIVAGPDEHADTERFKAALSGNLHALDTTAVFNLDELKALVSKLNLFISVDTGPIYIAEALGVATIDIVGPMDEREQPPRGPLHITVVPPGPRTPQLHIMNAALYDAQEANQQVESISADMVIKSFETIREAIGVRKQQYAS